MQRNAPENSREWASAMLRELEFIENDWAALLRALGSTSAIFGRSGSRNIAGVLAGVALAAALTAGAFGIVVLAFRFFPHSAEDWMPWLGWVALIGMPLSATALTAHVVVHMATHMAKHSG